MPRARTVGVLLLSVLAACGSTVPTSQRALRTTDGVITNDGVESLVAEGAPEGSGAAAGASSGGGGGRSSGTSTRATTAGRGAAGASSAVGPGVTAEAINIGLSYAVNSGAANTALGATGITQGDPKAVANYVIEDINKNGGVAGRKLQPVFHEVDGASTASYDVIAQQTCDDWTVDHKVFAAVAAGSENMSQCLHSRGVVQLSSDLSSSDAARFKRYPYLVEIGTINLDRLAATEVNALKAQNWFSGWNIATGGPGPAKAKVGIVTYDDPTFNHAVDASLVPALRALGYAPAAEDIIRVRPEERTSDVGATGAAVSSAVLKLRSDDVTHVIVYDERGVLTLLFLQAADSQGYRPRYGLNTQNGPQALMDGAALPARQLIGSKGMGWLPTLDLPSGQNPTNGPYSNASRRRCIAMLNAKGMTFSDVNAESIALGLCDTLWFFRDAVKLGGSVLNRVGFIAGVNRLDTSFLSTGSFGNRFSPTQHDGIAVYRHYEYDAGCGCMKYSSGNIALP